MSLDPLPSVNVYVQILHSCEDTCHIGLGPTFMILFYLNYVSDFEVLGLKHNEFWGGHCSAHNIFSRLTSCSFISLFLLSIPHHHQNLVVPFHLPIGWSPQDHPIGLHTKMQCFMNMLLCWVLLVFLCLWLD